MFDVPNLDGDELHALVLALTLGEVRQQVDNVVGDEVPERLPLATDRRTCTASFGHRVPAECAAGRLGRLARWVLLGE